MSIPKKPMPRQKTRRDNHKLAGVTRMTVGLDKITIHILRSQAVEHKVTQSEVLEMGMKLARNALKVFAGRQLPCICSLVPVDPVAVLANQVCQFAQLKVEGALAAKACPRITTAEDRTVSLFGTHSPEMLELRA
ncbi:hypothetical protein [Pseudomonas sp. LB3P31]